MKTMKCIFVLVCLLISVQLSAQEQTPIGSQQILGDGTYLVAEKMPEFPSGMNGLMKYLQTNVKYPRTAQENGVSGRVIVSFVVDVDGSLKDITVARGVNAALDAEAVRVISAMPLWIPGQDRGKAVRVKYTIPISFSLKGGNESKGGILLKASDAGITNKSLTGNWQLCKVQKNSDGSFQLSLLPVLKEIGGDKTFTNLYVSSQNVPSFISAQGKYKLKSKNIYVEVIDKKAMPQFPSWVKNDITYEFLHDNLVKFKFNGPVDGREIMEYWYRITPNKPASLMAD